MPTIDFDAMSVTAADMDMPAGHGGLSGGGEPMPEPGMEDRRGEQVWKTSQYRVSFSKTAPAWPRLDPAASSARREGTMSRRSWTGSTRSRWGRRGRAWGCWGSRESRHCSRSWSRRGREIQRGQGRKSSPRWACPRKGKGIRVNQF